MKNERALTILLKPHVSEKTVKVTASGGHVYGFKVLKDANKLEVKNAVQQLFNVKVKSVRIINVKSKPARFGRTKGRHSAWKKAYVGLEAGQELDLGSAQ